MERERFTKIAEQYQDMVYRIALNQLGTHADADDAVQEVFLRLYTAKNPPNGEDHLKNWLMRVTINYCRDVLKTPWRKRKISFDELATEPSFEEPEQSYLYHEVMKLPSGYRIVLYLFYYEDLPTQEIADLLHVRQTTVTTRLHRARKLLKQNLEVCLNDE